MTRWVLLLRGVNVGGRNTLRMADLRLLLEDLGHADVKTHLNSGNATFASARRSAERLAQEVEQALAARLSLSVRAAVRTVDDVRRAVDEVPPDLTGYVLVTALLGRPDPEGVARLTAWEPEVVRAGDGWLYVAYPDMARTRLTPAVLERHAGVPTTSRTPATLRRMLG